MLKFNNHKPPHNHYRNYSVTRINNVNYMHETPNWKPVKNVYPVNAISDCTSLLAEGDYVKVCNGREMFWVHISKITKTSFRGEVISHLYYTDTEYTKGDTVIFEKSQIREVYFV